MSVVFNSESEVTTQIERLELEARDVRRRIEHAHTPQDKRALNRQLEEIKQSVAILRAHLRV